MQLFNESLYLGLSIIVLYLCLTMAFTALLMKKAVNAFMKHSELATVILVYLWPLTLPYWIYLVVIDRTQKEK